MQDDISNGRVYRGAKTREISFPLGGIGTGCIGLSGSGRLIDWEIFNRPNKGSINGFSHFALRAEAPDGTVTARILNADLQPPYTGDVHGPKWESYGFGPRRGTLAGMPHFLDAVFTAAFPFAQIDFSKDSFPGEVRLIAFSPFIPGNDPDSSLPVAFFEVAVTNDQPRAMRYTVCLSITNPLPPGTTVNTYADADGLRRIHLTSNAFTGSEPDAGDLCMATDAPDTVRQDYWYRGQWFDSLGIFWRELSSTAPIPARTYADCGARTGFAGVRDTATLGARLGVEPGQTRIARFALSWSFPNHVNDWNPEPLPEAHPPAKRRTWKNYYATVFSDSVASARYAMLNWDRLRSQTLTFTRTLFASTVPEEALDAVSANLAVLKSPTCLRLEDGSFYGFEGCHCGEGCCEGSCTHVWNYAYALPFLFPRLERSMRSLDYRFNQGDDGGMAFRLQLPLGRARSTFRPCADGQFGGVIKAYRDWKISGDTGWLREIWPALRRSIEFAWSPSNPDRWDADQDGVLEGRQHHTLDMELFGPNAWLTGFYLAALKAGARMADHLGEKDFARRLEELFRRGKRWTDDNLFNGSYYHQRVDLRDRSLLEKYTEGLTLIGEGAVGAYWNHEAGEMKYQIAEGCEIDQVLAQWHANLCGLGEIFDPEQTRTALRSIHRNNFKRGMREFANPCRLYCLNDEAGLVVCDWPDGTYKPIVPLPYAEETQNGYEYAAAIQMIQSGLIEEGLECVAAIRSRYDGEKRNPWNEFECGSNYARSMASFALLPALSGFEYDLVEGMIGFSPRIREEDFSCLWSLDPGWGVFTHRDRTLRVRLLGGSLTVARFKSDLLLGPARTVLANGRELPFDHRPGEIRFASPIRIGTGQALEITTEA